MPKFSFPVLFEEAEGVIDFDFEDVSPPDLNFNDYSDWIKTVIQHHSGSLLTLQYIFCSDKYLHQLNVEFLDHDTLTDIITFPHADPPQVYGDLYISLERVAENAKERTIPFATELRRVMIHGVLHLLGYGDKTIEEAAKMRSLEEQAMKLSSN